MRVPFSPNYSDSFRVHEACEKYAFLLAKLCGLRSGGWEVNVGVGISFICALEGPDSLWTHQFIKGDPVPHRFSLSLRTKHTDRFVTCD